MGLAYSISIKAVKMLKQKIVTLEDNGLSENLQCDLYQKLPLGTIVRHENEGKHGGNGSTIQLGQGIVIDVEYQGLYVWGGHCFTAKVKWSNGEVFSCGLGLLKIV